MERPPAKQILLILISGLILSLPYKVSAHPKQVAVSETSYQSALTSFAVTVESLRQADANFRQERRIAGLLRPIISTGSVRLEADGALIWNQKFPFRVITRMTPDVIEETIEDSPLHRTTREQNPYLLAYSQAFVGLFTGNMQRLMTLFELQSIHTDTGWHVKLTPKDGNIKKVIRSINVLGTQRVEQIQIIEFGAGRTDIVLTY